ncbi:uncharacterized protein LOC131619980 [Vicia villosa]|uniref:uncharacterized protein LOC131619980 n=1 Tax=Vicia villosa TaxID=3911 RepID=UPI00273B5F06|nr:uncharacterized protein LOC131619980 [Vicia villosa]
MRMMKPLALFILILCTIQPNNAEDLIEETCHRSPYYFSECVNYVKSCPPPGPKNSIEVAIRLFDIMRDKALTTSIRIVHLLAARVGTPEYQALELCATSYKEIAVADYRLIRASLPRGDHKVTYDTAINVLKKVEKCEATLREKSGGRTPTLLTKENNETTVVVVIASYIVKSFL